MKKILVADDEKEEIASLIVELRNVYDVEYVPDGRQAIEAIERGGLDAAVLDGFMSPNDVQENDTKYHGYSVAKRARELYPNMILVWRSSITSGLIPRFLERMNVYIHKKNGNDKHLLDYLKDKLRE